MKELFRGYVMKEWFETNMNIDMYRSLNKIVVHKCIEFYAKCWKHRNKAYHDKERQ